MFNIGGGELLVIMLIALIVLGPQRLPDAARQVGKTMGDLRRLSIGFQNEIRSALDRPTTQPDRRRGATSCQGRAARRRTPGRPRRGRHRGRHARRRRAGRARAAVRADPLRKPPTAARGQPPAPAVAVARRSRHPTKKARRRRSRRRPKGRTPVPKAARRRSRG